MARKKTLTVATFVVLAVTSIGFWGFNNPKHEATSRLYGQQAGDSLAAQQDLLIGAERLSQAFRAAAKVLKPSVVTISSLVERPVGGTFSGDAGDLDFPPELRRMLPPEILRGLENQQRRRNPLELDNQRNPSAEEVEKIQTGIGSGVIVSDDGYVLTNNHVIESADELQVELSDGRVLRASVIGRDEKSDVAVLKIDANNLVAARLGDSAKMEVGDWAIAIGSPFGLDQTVTAGIISATNRQTGIISGGYEDFLQTDAAINPGNSGGPLVNLRGEVIGINTAINSRTGTNAGIGFAIPANMALRIMEDLKTEGRVVRGFIGATLGEVTAKNSAELDLPNSVVRGAVIERVLPNGPADRSALQAGDVVVEINGRPIRTFLQLRNLVALTRPGESLTFTLYRNGRLMDLSVTVGEQTDEKMGLLAGRYEVEQLGITIESLSDSIREQLRLDDEVQGAIITSIDRRGLGAEMGLRPGDVIIEVNGNPVTSARVAADFLERVDKNFRILVQRGNRLLQIMSSAQ